MRNATVFATCLTLLGCQPPPEAYSWPEEKSIRVDTDGEPAEETPQMPPEGPEANPGLEPPIETGTRPMGLLGRPDGPILPVMNESLVQVAVDLANEELEARRAVRQRH